MKQLGFTLIELTLVMLTIIVCAGMALPVWQQHLIERHKAITPDGIYHRTVHCLYWQDSNLNTIYHCWKGDQHVKQSNVSRS